MYVQTILISISNLLIEPVPRLSQKKNCGVLLNLVSFDSGALLILVSLGWGPLLGALELYYGSLWGLTIQAPSFIPIS